MQAVSKLPGLSAFLVWLCLASVSLAAPIEAVKGKSYHITKRHGPWMIMVASMKTTSDALPEGAVTAEEAAAELVYELRTKGIPAYTYQQEEEVDTIDSIDRLGRPQKRRITTSDRRIVVLAGNYPSIEDKVGQKTLNYIKRLYPKSLKEGNYKKTPGRPGPLSGAFMAVNPLLSPDEVRRYKVDPLIVHLNSGAENSLLDNSARYSLTVISFYGKQKTQSGAAWAQQDFKVSDALDEAAQSAWEVAALLRQRGFEAYVLHERYRSIVTIGGFNDPQDKKIAEVAKMFGAKVKRNPTTGQDVLTAEIISIPGNNPNDAPTKTYIFDPQPTLIEVPRVR